MKEKEKMSGKLQLLVGMIASGKSTYSKRAAQKGIICLNDDSIVSMIHGGDYTLYDKNLKILYKSLEHKIIEMGLALEKTILIDRGLNINKKARERYLAIAKSLDVECEALYFEPKDPFWHSQQRYWSDDRGHALEYWDKVAIHHAAIWSIPTIEEGFSRVVKLEKDCEVIC